MVTKEIIQRVQSAYSKGVQSSSSRLSSRHIYNKILSTRNRLLSQKSNKNQKLSDWNYIILPCVELIKVNNHECPCLPHFGCQVFRTKHPLPKPLSNYDGYIMDWVLALNTSDSFDEISREAYLNIKGNKYTSESNRYIIEGDHAYFYGKNVPLVIKMKYVPEDPLEAASYPSYCDKEDCTDCYDCESPLDKEFAIEGDLIDTLIELASQELIGVFNQGIEDKTNDRRDNPTEQTK